MDKTLWKIAEDAEFIYMTSFAIKSDILHYLGIPNAIIPLHNYINSKN